MLEAALILRRQWGERWLIYLCVTLVYASIFGAGGVVGLLIHFSRPYAGKRFFYGVWTVGIVWADILVVTGSAYPTWGYWLGSSLPLGGLAHLVLLGLLRLHDWYLHPPTWDAYLLRQEQQTERQQESKLQTTLTATKPSDPRLSLGVLVARDTRARLPDGMGLSGQHLFADEGILNQHLLLIGAPGSGKSEALKCLIAEVLAKTERDVFVVDGKGESDFAHGVHDLFARYRNSAIPVFQMGTGERGDPYNSFVGTGEAIKQRLTAMFNVEQQQGDGEFYANVNRALLNLVCLAPDGTPRSLHELDERLSLGWLKYCYRGDERKLRALERYEPFFDGFRVRADSLIWDFADYLAADGFSLDTSTGAVFSLRTAALGDTARRFLNFLVEDFKDWVGKRQQRPALLVIDEFGQFENQSIIALLELARSAKLGILLATQDLSTVKERDIRERILSSVQTKILLKTDTPEVIGDLAGTYSTAHLTYQMDETDLTGLGSIRLEDERKVDLNAVRRFPPGRAYLIRSGVGLVMQFIPNRS